MDGEIVEALSMERGSSMSIPMTVGMKLSGRRIKMDFKMVPIR